MHLVFLNQYYPPDVAPTGVVLRDLAERLAADGHQVTVLCAEGGYGENAEKRKSEGAESGREGAEDSRFKRGEEGAVADAQWGGTETAIGQPTSGPRVVRIGATRFGRGSFVGKLLDYLSYYLGVAWRLSWMQPRPDRIIALTTPPYLSVLARVFSKLRRADHAHWVMDLYPDVMSAHGMLGERHPLFRLLAVLARWGFGGKRSAAVVALGPDMAERVAQRMGSTAGISWVPLWGTAAEGGEADAAAVRELRHARGWADDALVVMYSGNMGLGHSFDEVLGVAVEDSRLMRPYPSGIKFSVSSTIGQAPDVRGDDGSHGQDARGTIQKMHLEDHAEPQVPPGNEEPGCPQGRALLTKNEITSSSLPIRFVFFGGGKRKPEVEAFAREHPQAGIEVHGYAPMEILGAHLRSADVHLASLRPEWSGSMVPSKLQGIFAAGRPVVFVGDARSSIGRWIAESGGGWVVAPGDAAGLRDCLAEAGDPAERARRGHAARVFARANFDRARNTAMLTAQFSTTHCRTAQS